MFATKMQKNSVVKRKSTLVPSYQLHNYIQVFPISFDDLHICICI